MEASVPAGVAFYRFVVEGRVQGVGFRVATRHEARRRRLRGWVRNREDGAVEGAVEGTGADLAAFRAWIRRGPPLAQVLSLSWEPWMPTGETEFSIRD